MFAKASVGNMHQRLEIRGTSSFIDPTGRSGGLFVAQGVPTAPGGGRGASFGGLLANASNIGTFVKDRFSVIPESARDVRNTASIKSGKKNMMPHRPMTPDDASATPTRAFGWSPGNG